MCDQAQDVVRSSPESVDGAPDVHKHDVHRHIACFFEDCHVFLASPQSPCPPSWLGWAGVIECTTEHDLATASAHSFCLRHRARQQGKEFTRPMMMNQQQQQQDRIFGGNLETLGLQATLKTLALGGKTGQLSVAATHDAVD